MRPAVLSPDTGHRATVLAYLKTLEGNQHLMVTLLQCMDCAVGSVSHVTTSSHQLLLLSVVNVAQHQDAFTVYLQLPEADRKKLNKVKEALVAAFAADPFIAYEQFVSRKLHSGEYPVVFLAELQQQGRAGDWTGMHHGHIMPTSSGNEEGGEVSWKLEAISILTVSGKEHFCKGTGIMRLHLSNRKAVDVDMLVVDTTPLGFPFISRMNSCIGQGHCERGMMCVVQSFVQLVP
ncbi:hypothetical protein O3P69_020695 [Scylla paramamosain]|uniref:Uncharacterized protein n=1 Tax=Scylla paramamosain TaxID=85552 RepID=A0AAW0TRC9_SCYPA